MTAVYIHYPYCETLCPYCDFFSSTRQQDAEFFPTLIADLEQWFQWLNQGPVESLYFGGGTPSRMPLAGLQQVMDAVGRLWGWSASATAPVEVTFEANPGDVRPDLVAGWLDAGVSRVSLGTQSFCDTELTLLGRRHNAQEAYDATRLIAQAGFESFSCDLIFGLPGQRDADLEANLEVLAELQPPHLSLYGLTIEDGTAFATDLERGTFQELDRVRWLAMYERVCQWAKERGYHQYEVSNFAFPGHESRHNRAYWRNCSWVGAGPAAHGQRVTAHGLERRGHPRSVRAWMESIRTPSKAFLTGPGLREELPLTAWFRETCMIGLRDLERGIEPERWAAQLGIEDPALLQVVDRGRALGWIEPDDPCRLTPVGLLHSDQMAEMVLNA